MKERGGGDLLYPSFKDSVLRLELSNICNHSCIFCVNRNMPRKKIHMREELIYRIIKESVELGVKKAGFFINGEPFISKNLDKYIRFAKDSGFEYIFITTNGALATEESLKNVLNAGLDSIKFSINAGNKESYIKIHCKDDFDKVIRNLMFVYNFRKKSNLDFKILTSFVVTKFTYNEVEDYYNFIKNYVDDIVFFNASSFAGINREEIDELYVDISNKAIPVFESKSESPCKQLFNSINITCEGFLSLCCSEPYNLLSVLDINHMNLKDAWYSKEMVNLRKKHLENNVEDIQCYNCINRTNLDIKPLNNNLYKSS